VCIVHQRPFYYSQPQVLSRLITCSIFLPATKTGGMASDGEKLPNGDDGDEETLRGRLRQLGVAPEKIAACTTPGMLGFLLQKVRGPFAMISSSPPQVLTARLVGQVSTRANLASGGTMVISAPAQPSPLLPTLQEALNRIPERPPSARSARTTSPPGPSSAPPPSTLQVSFQVVGPGCTPVPLVLDLDASRTISQAKIALACLLSAITGPDAPPSQTTPVRVAPGQLQLVHAGSIVGDHVRLCKLQGMTPAHGAPRDSVPALPPRPCLPPHAVAPRVALHTRNAGVPRS